LSVKGVIGFRGMKPSGNELALPAGSSIEALNCVIPSKDELMPRRGQRLSTYIDNDPTDANLNRAKELYQWGPHLMVHYSGNAGGKLAMWSNWATSPAYTLLGSYDEPDTTLLRMKFAELTQGLYWTTSAGLYTKDQNGARRAGIPRPDDFFIGENDGGIATRLASNPNASGTWFAKDKAVAYRAVVGLKDGNGVVRMSAPNGRIVIVNPADLTMAAGSVVLAGGTVTVTLAAGQSHGFRVADIVNLTLTGGDVGNLTATNRQLLSVTPSSFTYADPKPNYINVANVVFTSGTKTVQLLVKLPAEAVKGWFVQIYRSDEAATAAIDPGDELFLAYEKVLSAADIAATAVTIQDTTPSAFLGEPLPTNPNTGDGIARAAERPPLCRDICTWDGRLWGAQCKDKHRMTLHLLGCGSPYGLQNGDVLAINTRAYIFGDGAYLLPFDVNLITQDLPTRNIERTAQQATLVIGVNSPGIETTYTFDGDSPVGTIAFAGDSPVSTFVDGSSGPINAIYAAASRPSAWSEGVAATKLVTAAGTARTLGTTVTVQCVGHGFSVGDVVMLSIRADGTPDANFPLGLKTVTAVVDPDHFKYSETGANAVLGGTYQHYFYATTFKSNQRVVPVAFSEQDKPEAWPLLFTLGGLPDGVEALRIKPSASGDQLFVFLRDNATYVVSGQYPYSVRKFDRTAPLVAADSLQEHSSQLYGLTAQGICQISEGGIGNIGLDVQDMTRLIVAAMRLSGQSLSQIFGVSYETDNQYLLFTPTEDSNNPGRVTSTVQQALVLQSMLGQFTRWDTARTCGIVWRDGDYLVLGDGGTNRLRVERKGYTFTDFADADYSFTKDGSQTNVSTIDVLPPDNLTRLSAGDAVLIGGAYYRITDIDPAGQISIDGTVTVAGGATITAYAKYTVQHTWAGDSGGTPGVESRWRHLQLHFKEHLFKNITLSFQGEKAANIENVTVEDTTFAMATPVKRLTNSWGKVADNFERAAILRISCTLQEALSYFRLLGISRSAQPITEKTGA